jgi:Spy/CpxP family protein refolding chaperone
MLDEKERCDAARRSTVASPLRVLPVGAVDDNPPAHHAAELTDRSCIRDGPLPGAIVLSRENDMNRWFAGVLAVAATWLACMTMVSAQTGAPPPAATEKEQHRISDQDIALMRQDIRSKKKQLIAQNLKLTDAEATKFWPIYDQYTAELVKINDKKYAVIQEYADHYGTLTDEQATKLARQWMDVDIAAAQLRAKYLPIVSQAIGGRKGATFAQLDRRVSLMVELQLASQIPLVQSQ